MLTTCGKSIKQTIIIKHSLNEELIVNLQFTDNQVAPSLFSFESGAQVKR